ncbi:MAG: SGNH/GDSL hydrolase family protein [Lachnospiraceae bacterium]
MKKINIVFLGECIIIAALLLLIGSLLRESPVTALGKEKEDCSIAEATEAKEENQSVENIQYAKDLLAQKQEQEVSGNEGAVSQNSVSENQTMQADEESIVVFADSIWDGERGADGISERLEESLGVEVYNCSIGGTTAAVVSEPTDLREGWKSYSLNGLMYIARKEVSADSLLTDLPALEEIKSIDFNEADYLIIAYGLNDFFSRVDIYPNDMFDMSTYVGALRHAVAKMKETFPDLKIILVAPTYCELYDDPNEESLEAYAEAVRMVAQEYGTYFWDMYHELGINAQNKDQYLEDGVHLSAEGRKLYADYAAGRLVEIRSDKME